MTPPAPDRDQLVTLLDSVTDAVFTLDRGWRLTYVNRAARERIGRPADELVGRHGAEVLPHVEGASFAGAYERAFATGVPVQEEAWVPAFAGWYEVNGFPAGSSLTVAFREITGRRRRDLTRSLHDQLAAVLEHDVGPVDALLAVARELRRITDVALAEVWIGDGPDGGLRLAGADHDGDPDLEPLTSMQEVGADSLPARVLASGAPAVVDDLGARHLSRRAGVAAAVGLRTSIHLPFVVDGASPAVVGLLSRQGPGTTDWPAILTGAHGDLVDLVQRQRERHDSIRDQRLGEAQRRSLAGIVLGDPLEATGGELARAIEDRFPGTLASLHRYDPDGDVLHLLAAPSHPEAYREAVVTLPVGPDEGACGRAAHGRTTVVLPDLATGAGPSRETVLAREHGFVAAWSEPVVGGDGELLGTLGVRCRVPGRPGRTERRVLADLARLAGIAILRERSDRQLADSERRFRLLSRATSDGVYDWDLRTGKVIRSEGYVALFGETREGLDSELASWTSRIHEDDRARVLTGVREVLDADDETWQDSYRFARADGTIAHVVDRGTIIRDDDGTPVRVIGAVVDDSDRFELEQQYLRAQRLESIGTLAGGIAHDLNNVLAPILMATDLLALDELTTEQQEVVDTIASSAERGAGMVRQVLTFARGVSTERRPVDPRELLADVQRMARDTFPRSIEVEVSCPDELDLVAGDAVQLQQVLLNLAVNARDAMPDGGCLRLSATTVEVDDAYAAMVPGARAGRYVRITVEDTGAGMEDAVLERLFEPFFTTKAPGSGTGLGMPTSHGIVVAHNGFLEVDTEVGRGTTIEVNLPVAAGAVAAPRTSPRGGTQRGEGELVLVVDDERSVRTITRQTLEAAGYRVLTAEDGARAIAVYAEHRDEVALVVTDVMMPVMDGTAAINALRRIDPEVRVIAVSGLTTHLRGLSAPAPFLTKPFTTETLLHAVETELAPFRDAARARKD